MTDIFSVPIFPAADVFPMMVDDELKELAADIAANGLRDPLVIATVDGVEMLIDGRNRRAACKAAGVEPTTRKLNGEDPTAFVISVNARRRHMSKGALAMAVAMIYPEPEKGGRGKKGLRDANVLPTATALSRARTVLRYSRPLAEAVLIGVRSLDDAYQEAIAAKKAADTDDARLATMRADAPDLADLLVEDRMKLPEAWAAFEQRQAKAAADEANKRETMLRLSEAAYRGTVAWANAEFVSEVRARLADDGFRRALTDRLRLTPDEVKLIGKGADHLFSILKGV